MRLLPVMVVLLFFTGISKNTSAQVPEHIVPDTVKIYLVKLKDGTEFTGHVIYRDSTNIILRTASIPRLEIAVAQVQEIEEMSDASIKKGKFWFGNPHATRYLFGPSAINLKKGEGYYQNTLLFLNSFNYGLTDFFSIGGGIEFISTFSGYPIAFITPKVSFRVADKFYAGGGVLFVTIPELEDGGSRGTAGILYGVSTYGTKDHNLTGGLGYGFVKDEFVDRPFITISGMTRFTRKASFVTENWIIPGEDGGAFFTYGVRFFGEKIAVDLALMNNRDIIEVIPVGIPFVSFVIKF